MSKEKKLPRTMIAARQTQRSAVLCAQCGNVKGDLKKRSKTFFSQEKIFSTARAAGASV
jgi:hypothetical protein